IEQVNQTVTQMDEATQQNAALVEEATAAARSMEEQARELTETVAVFKIDDAPATTAPASRRQAISAPSVSAMVKAQVSAATRTVRAAPKRAVGAGAAATDTSWHEF
ncbi:chemotaxis protein, partial [Xanthomonas sp. Sa3BUA13]|nr:chemotaxis protein [Xanthomonas surreyensis]